MESKHERYLNREVIDSAAAESTVAYHKAAWNCRSARQPGIFLEMACHWEIFGLDYTSIWDLRPLAACSAKEPTTV
jgi:hypothetical protein